MVTCKHLTPTIGVVVVAYIDPKGNNIYGYSKVNINNPAT